MGPWSAHRRSVTEVGECDGVRTGPCWNWAICPRIVCLAQCRWSRGALHEKFGAHDAAVAHVGEDASPVDDGAQPTVRSGCAASTVHHGPLIALVLLAVALIAVCGAFLNHTVRRRFRRDARLPMPISGGVSLRRLGWLRGRARLRPRLTRSGLTGLVESVHCGHPT